MLDACHMSYTYGVCVQVLVYASDRLTAVVKVVKGLCGYVLD